MAELNRPSVVTAAVWLLVAGGAMLAVGGLIIGSVSFDILRQVAPDSVPDEAVQSSLWLYRGVGLLFTLAAVALIVLALRARRRDRRYRRATVALAMAVVVLAAVAAVAVGSHILVLLGLFTIVVGTLLLSRPVAVAWYTAPAEGVGQVPDV